MMTDTDQMYSAMFEAQEAKRLEAEAERLTAEEGARADATPTERAIDDVSDAAEHLERARRALQLLTEETAPETLRDAMSLSLSSARRAVAALETGFAALDESLRDIGK